MSAINLRPTHSDVAVIDVGSNSVRLVLYRMDGRAIWSVYNEKVLAGLGRDLSRTGALSPAGVDAALTVLARFRALIDAAKPRHVFAAATAAVRDASDGEAFRHRVRGELGIDLRILSGEEEALASAMGVLAGAPQARGLVGDLGGASLELIRLGPEGPEPGVTLPLGPFSVDASLRLDPLAVRRYVDQQAWPIASRFRTETLHAVGGAWRNLALLQMRLADYPLEVVHQYEISRRDALDATRFVSQQSRGSLERIPGISKRRLEDLPHAATVLQSLIEHLDIQIISFSAFGLREGLVWQAMSEEVRAQDPLIAGCANLGGRGALAEELGAALEAWLAPAFARLEPVFGDREPRLLAAACRLAELGAQLHPDHRADLVFEQTLRAPIAGMDHAERAFLAQAAFSRHTAQSQAPEPVILGRLLTPERQIRARALGAAIRLGCDLSGRSAELIDKCRLQIKANSLVVETQPDWSAVLLGDQTTKRAQTLASLLGKDLKLRAADRPTLVNAG
ncbi:MAG: Ppx/GppA family phosphatase [Alphaproteobacteria bacterium]|jgi:exopolyphosphatase/guanosine-5'-triphosphate,3'-diphosphate pyrophosphatase|nr:Ppx/GppA family phosphatase [Alphaproteobacteria bacterium]